MKISTNVITFLNQHYDSAGDIAQGGVKNLVKKIGAQLGEVEEVVNLGDKFNDVTIVKIVECQPHPNADRLKICKIDDNGQRPGLDRDENGYVQVVCGAPNARPGILVLWLPPGATVPESYGSDDPFVLETRALRGEISNGMLASPRELSLGDAHDGIFEISHQNDISGNEAVKPGVSLSDVCNLRDETIIDIENKMFTHRPDCFGLLGVAREVEGIHQRAYKSPAWYVENPEIPEVSDATLPLKVRNEIPRDVPRFTAITLENVKVGPSPLWLQMFLMRFGLRSINNVVDYTNWYMLLSGQPLHAYDYDKVRALDDADEATIVVRHPRDGEKLTLLNGKEITPRPEAIMIATEKKLIGLGGVMGGAETEVDETTTKIILEAANFDMYSIRRTSMAHGLFTDAVTRFNKGQSPRQTRTVLAKTVDHLVRYENARVASRLIDEQSSEFAEPRVRLTPQFINERLGLQLSPAEITTLLENVEFTVHESGDSLEVVAPFWRTDIAIREDVVEEIGRLYGYDHLPLELPRRSARPTQKNHLLELKNTARRSLAKLGANEVLTYSFVHGQLLAKVGQDVSQAFELSNALSPDLQYYRLSLTPSLLDKINSNIRAGHKRFAIFEIGKAHIIGQNDEDNLPRGFERLALVVTTDDKIAPRGQAAFYQAKRYLEQLLMQFGVDAPAYQALAGETDSSTSYYNAARAATISVAGTIIGHVGEYASPVRAQLKLPAYTAGFEIDLAAVQALSDSSLRYQPLSKYPKIEQDLCLKVAHELAYQDVYDAVRTALDREIPDHVSVQLLPIDIYQRADDTAHKQITLRISLTSHETTLVNDDVNALIDRVASEVHTALGAERV